MAAANGFVTTEPDTRYGAGDRAVYATAAYAQQFTCGGSGAQQVTVIGVYAHDPLDLNANITLGIFTDDAANGCPGDLVTNSEATIANTSGLYGRLRSVYGTTPVVTGGSVYWIALIPGGTAYVSGDATGGISASKLATYPTFPDGDGWHSPTTGTLDYSFYAVYTSGPSGAPVPLSCLRTRTIGLSW